MSAEEPGSITRWLRGLKAGRPEAVEAIWRRYYDRVLAVARDRLRGGPHQAVEDGEDVALSALHGLADAARGAGSTASTTASTSGRCSPPSR